MNTAQVSSLREENNTVMQTSQQIMAEDSNESAPIQQEMMQRQNFSGILGGAQVKSVKDFPIDLGSLLNISLTYSFDELKKALQFLVDQNGDQ